MPITKFTYYSVVKLPHTKCNTIVRVYRMKIVIIANNIILCICQVGLHMFASLDNRVFLFWWTIIKSRPFFSFLFCGSWNRRLFDEILFILRVAPLSFCTYHVNIICVKWTNMIFSNMQHIPYESVILILARSFFR